LSDPTERQVLYALVAGGFLAVVLVLVVGAAVSGLVPLWWTWAASITLAVLTTWAGLNWRRTGAVLTLAMAVFLLWVVVTLVIAR
jgi:hypothetical protein